MKRTKKHSKPLPVHIGPTEHKIRVRFACQNCNRFNSHDQPGRCGCGAMLGPVGEKVDAGPAVQNTTVNGGSRIVKDEAYFRDLLEGF
jgi:hypothetical protein